MSDEARKRLEEAEATLLRYLAGRVNGDLRAEVRSLLDENARLSAELAARIKDNKWAGKEMQRLSAEVERLEAELSAETTAHEIDVHAFRIDEARVRAELAAAREQIVYEQERNANNVAQYSEQWRALREMAELKHIDYAADSQAGGYNACVDAVLAALSSFEEPAAKPLPLGHPFIAYWGPAHFPYTTPVCVTCGGPESAHKPEEGKP